MVGTILYVVNVDQEAGKTRFVLWIHLLSYVFGSIFIGAVLSVVGEVLKTVFPQLGKLYLLLAVTGGVGLIYGLKEIGLLQIPIPRTYRQVPSKWRLTLPTKLLAVFYGFELGMGITTYVTVTTFYVVIVWVLLNANSLSGMLVMSFYGIGRALPLAWLALYASDNDRRTQIVNRTVIWEPVVHVLNGLILITVGTIFFLLGMFARSL
jgi:cytochrome c biogenesis protein CcdA